MLRPYQPGEIAVGVGGSVGGGQLQYKNVFQVSGNRLILKDTLVCNLFSDALTPVQNWLLKF